MKLEDTRKRMRRLAELMLEAEDGLHEYQNGDSPRKRDGSPRINKMQLLREAGYTESYAKAIRGSIWKNPYYQEQYTLLRRQRKSCALEALVNTEAETGLLSSIDESLMKLTLKRLTDPEEQEKIKTETLLKYGHVYHRLAAEVSGQLGDNRVANKLAGLLAGEQSRLPKDQRDSIKSKVIEARTRFRAEIDTETKELAQVGDAQDDIIEVEAEEV